MGRVPLKAARDRSSTQSVPVSRPSSKILPDLPSDAVEDVAGTDIEDAELPPPSEAMDVEDIALIDPSEEVENDGEAVVEAMVTLAAQPESGVEEDLVDEDETTRPNPQVSLLWPNVETDRAEIFARRIEEVRKTFKDEVDMYDTTMVSEYADDILAYMGELEVQTMPNPDYLSTQLEVTP